MGPPLQTTAGTSIRTAAMTMPGTILSQLGTNTSPSSWWAMNIVSTLSQISSRLAREYFMPTWPMAMPSQTPMAGMRMGVPPAMRTPALTASAILSRWAWPGTISLWAETTPISGRSSSSGGVAQRIKQSSGSVPARGLFDIIAVHRFSPFSNKAPFPCGGRCASRMRGGLAPLPVNGMLRALCLHPALRATFPLGEG